MRARLATAVSAAHRSRRCLRAAPAHSPCHARPNPPRLRRARSRARCRLAADEPPTGPLSAAPGGPHRPLRHPPATSLVRRQPGSDGSACRGVSAVRGARGAAADPRGVVVRSPGGAFVHVPVWGGGAGRDIATVRAPRRLRGGSDQGGVGLGMVAGRAGAGWGSARAGQAPPRAPARVSLLECMHSNGISYYRDTTSRVCHGIGPRVLLRVV
jgi:hypothetical protein